MNRYPRPGDRIAPITLRQVLLEEAPRHLVGPMAASGLRLCDLDETVWQKLPQEAIVELGRMIVARVAAGCAKESVQQRHFPRPPRGAKLEDLRLEHRTHLCLAREGFAANPQKLGECTIGDVLTIRSFGPRCLVDLLSSLETLLARDGRLDPELTREAKRLAVLPEAARARRQDPRFGRLMREIDVEAPTAQELASRLTARTQDPPDPPYVTGQVRRLRERIAAMPDLTLEEELIQIFASTAPPRNRQIVVGYYGWADGRSHTLAEIGARHGMTRERTRQICAKLVRRENPGSIPAPVMDRTLAFAEERLPCSVPRLEQQMMEAGLTAVGLGLEHVQTAAGLLGRPIPLVIVRVGQGKLAVPPQQVGVPAGVAELAKKEVYYHGLANVGQICEVLSERFSGDVGRTLVVETLRLLDGLRWLDEQTGWFRLRSAAKHGLPKAIDKVLAVAGRITAEELRRALGRNRRVWEDPPPERVLLEFCRQTRGMRVEGKRIVADPPRSWKQALTGVEAQLVEILKRHGPVMERGALEDIALADGMNRFSFHAFIASSPVIAQYGHSIYGLVGAEVSPETIQSLIDRRRAERAPTRVLETHGQTDDGKVRLSYRLSKAASTYAVVTVPAALKHLVSGKFRLLSTDGVRVGTLAAKDGRAWGLGAFLRQHHARRGDYVVLTLDLERRTAVIAIRKEASTGE